MRIQRRSLSLIVLLAALSSSIFSEAQEINYPGDRFGYDNTTPRAFAYDEQHIDECGACHMAYPPELLPKESWKKIMLGLDDHFGENAELDDGTFTHIDNYLQQHALSNDHPTIETVSSWFRSLPENAPIRITALPGFLEHHKDPIRRLGEGSDEEGFFSPCEDCHKEAASGVFDKEQIFRGYGPVFKRFSGEN